MTMAPTDFAGTKWGYVYDGDQHIHEPRDFWYDRLPKKYQDRAPRTVTGPDGKDYYQSGDGKTTGVTDMRTAVAGVSELDWDVGTYAYDELRPSAWDPKARLEDMDLDYVYAGIIHPNRTDYGLFANADTDLIDLCVSIYNDWMSEFCSVDPDRLLGLAQIPSTGVENAIIEMRRARAGPQRHPRRGPGQVAQRRRLAHRRR